jgi:hypothetical protein
MAKHHVAATVNGDAVEFLCETEDTLLDVLRDQLGLTGTKEGCSTGDCGACSVTVNGRLVCSCLMLGVEANGKAVATIEGIWAGYGPVTREKAELPDLFLERHAFEQRVDEGGHRRGVGPGRRRRQGAARKQQAQHDGREYRDAYRQGCEPGYERRPRFRCADSHSYVPPRSGRTACAAGPVAAARRRGTRETAKLPFPVTIDIDVSKCKNS